MERRTKSYKIQQSRALPNISFLRKTQITHTIILFSFETITYRWLDVWKNGRQMRGSENNEVQSCETNDGRGSLKNGLGGHSGGT